MTEQGPETSPAPRLRITNRPSGELALAGEIDLTTAPAVQRALEEAGGRGGGAVTVDLSQITYLSSAGVGALFDHAKTSDLTILVAAGSAVEKVVRVCGLEVLATVQVLPEPAPDTA